MRILFMGTPDFAVASLKRLTEDGHTICGVFTQPDKPKNRGHKLTFSPVKEYALSQGFSVFQPTSLRNNEILETIQALCPELIVVAAYGKILPEEILNIPPFGAVNVHSSLLPKYRGAAPVNWAILNGETETGVSIMYMAKELDAGDIILQKATPISQTENAQSLLERLSILGAEALSEAVRAIENGTASRTPQDHEKYSYAPMLSREMSEIDWKHTAHMIQCQIRGLIPWPCAVTNVIRGERIKIYAAEETGETTSALPGKIVAVGKENGIEIACGDGKILRITELQSPNGKRMTASAWLLGHPVTVEKE